MVGGLVRDLLLSRESKDIDLIVLSGPRGFADAVAKRCGGSLRQHDRFLTADFTSDAGYEIDVVRARSEVYRSPAALPTVRSGTLIEDLFRRDFTVNAMALPLTGPDEDIVDPFHGYSDLKRGRLRVLHERSFLDDPTRLLRGLRLGHRLGLALEAHTAQLAEQALAQGAFDRLSGVRLRTELQRLLHDPSTALDLLPNLADLELESILHPQLVLPEMVTTCLGRMAADPGTETVHQWVTVLCALTWNLDSSQRAQVADRLSLDASDRRLLLELPPLVHSLSQRLETLDSAHERFQLGSTLGPIGRVLARCWAGPQVASFLETEWPALCARRPLISGRDLIGLGFAPDPSIGRALEATLRARLEGRIGRTEELLYAARWLQQKATTDVDARPDRSSRTDHLDSGDSGRGGR